MNTKLFKLITAGALAVLLSSCGDTVVDNDDSNPVQKKATLNVRVRDAITGNPLEATVTLNTTGKSIVTDANGNFSFKSIPIGSHSVLVEKAGYASAIVPASIPTTNGSGGATGGGNIAIATDYTADVNLYPKTASLQGYVYSEDNDGNIAAIAGATVRVEVTSSQIVDKIISSVTNTTGLFKFDALPAVGTGYTISFSDPAKKYRIKQYPSTSVPDLKADFPSYITTAVKFTTSELNSLFELVAYPSIIKSTDTLTFTFNNKIDFSKFNLNDIVSLVGIDGFPAYPTPLGSGVTLTRIPSVDSTKLVLALSGPNGNTVPHWPSGGFKVYFKNLKAIDGKSTADRYTHNEFIYTSDNTVKFELKNHKTLLDTTEALDLEFSIPIDSAIFKPGWITLSDGIFAQRVVAANSNIIKLVPVGGKWPDGFTVSISSDLQAVNGVTLGTAATNFGITLKATDISGLLVGPFIQVGVADYNLSTPIKVRFKKVSGASHYRIYGKASAGYKKTEFVYLDEFVSQSLFNNPDSMEYTITNTLIPPGSSKLGLNYEDRGGPGNPPAIAVLQDKNTLQLFIQALKKDANDVILSETSIANSQLPANVLTVTDKKGPTISNAAVGTNILYEKASPPQNPYAYITVTNGGYSQYGDNSLQNLLLSGTALPAVGGTPLTRCVRFSEPMDTTAATTAALTTSFVAYDPTPAELLAGALAESGVPLANVAAKLAVTAKWGSDYNATLAAIPVNELLCLSVTSNAATFLQSGSKTVKVRARVTGLKDVAGNPLSIVVTPATVIPEVSSPYLDIRYEEPNLDVFTPPPAP